MPGKPLPRHLLDLEPTNRELLTALRAAGGYAFTQQLVELWPQSRASAYRAIKRLAEWGALDLYPMPPRSVAILTRPGARYLGFEDHERGEPSHFRLISGVYRLEWFIQSGGRHLSHELPIRSDPHLPDLEAARDAARQTVEAVVAEIRAAESARGQLQSERANASGRLFGGQHELSRLTEAIAAKDEEIAILTVRHREAQGALREAQEAMTHARLALEAETSAAWSRSLRIRGVFLDPADTHGLTFVACDINRSRSWVRGTLRFCSQVAGSYRLPWRCWVLTHDSERTRALTAMISEILSAVPHAVERYRRAAGQKAKDQAEQGIIDPLPTEAQAINLGISRYLRAPGGRKREIADLFSPRERSAITQLGVRACSRT